MSNTESTQNFTEKPNLKWKLVFIPLDMEGKNKPHFATGETFFVKKTNES